MISKKALLINGFRGINLALVVLCYLPVFLGSEMAIAKNDALYKSMSSDTVRAAIYIVLGSAASLITDDALYLVERIHVTENFVVSRRLLILSVVVPLSTMLVGMYNQDLTLYFSSFTASYALQASSILEPLILSETTAWKRTSLIIMGTIRTWGIFAGHYRFFFAHSELFALISIIFYSICTGFLFIACLTYIYHESFSKKASSISVTSFASCTLLNIMSRIVIPISFGVTNWSDYHALAMALFLLINLPILITATVLPGRIARHEALVAQKSVVRFISHEIRTPMNTIHLGIDELLKSEEPSHADLLQDMKAASELAVDTLNDLISQEGFEESLLALDLIEENAYDMVVNIVNQSQRHAMQGGFILEIMNVDRLKVELQACVLHIDKPKLSQAIRSIIINSSRMTPMKGHVYVNCFVQQVPSAANALEVAFELHMEISNDGPGITNEARRKIFDANELVALDFGTGMGTALSLWTAKRIIDHHGGHVEAKSSPENRRCTFHINLPLDNALDRSGSSHAASNHQNSAIRHTDEVRSQAAPEYNCLIVDDAPAVRKMIGRVVKNMFETIAFAANGEEATQLVANALQSANLTDKFDIIFMDRCMPMKDGIAATRDIRNMGFQGVILGVTGDALAEDVEAFLQAGADKVVTKPVKVDMFIELIDDFKAGRRTVTPRALKKMKKYTTKIVPADIV